MPGLSSLPPDRLLHLAQQILPPFFGGLAIALALALLWVRRQRRALGSLELKVSLAVEIADLVRPERGLAGNLFGFLGVVARLVPAGGYYFYLRDAKNGAYVLRSVRREGEEADPPGPNYSGLAAYHPEEYSPPLTLPPEYRPGVRTRPVPEGDVVLLEIPVKGEVGLIRLGPVRRPSPSLLSLLDFLGERLAPALELVLRLEETEKKMETAAASGAAVRSLVRSVLDLDGSLSLLLALAARFAEAAGGCLLLQKNGLGQVAAGVGLEEALEAALRQDREAQRLLHELVGGSGPVYLDRKRPEYAQLPPYLAAAGGSFLLLPVCRGEAEATVVLWRGGEGDLEKYRLDALAMLAERMGDVLEQQAHFRELNRRYIVTLKTLVDSVDNLDPYTVGHSELVSRYAGIAAWELGLAGDEFREIVLAGYLHDVGMLALGGNLLFKEGRYTEPERENMRLHPEVGAAIVEATLGKGRLAAYIRHHHERWDGYGYPDGLRGEEIPLGARIVAVADRLNALLTGRRYREPLPFERALAELKAAGGKQLDPNLVELYLSWFRKKQADPSRRGRSLGPCWEMRCCPPHIHRSCPAYGDLSSNCWEVEGVNCAAHGGKCPTCMIYTEFVYRSGQPVARPEGG